MEKSSASVETKLQLFGHNAQGYVWPRKGDTLTPKNTLSTVKHGGSSLTLWACLAANGTGD